MQGASKERIPDGPLLKLPELEERVREAGHVPLPTSTFSQAKSPSPWDGDAPVTSGFTVETQEIWAQIFGLFLYCSELLFFTQEMGILKFALGVGYDEGMK